MSNKTNDQLKDLFLDSLNSSDFDKYTEQELKAKFEIWLSEREDAPIYRDPMTIAKTWREDHE